MKKLIIITIFSLIRLMNTASQVVISEKASIKFNNTGQAQASSHIETNQKSDKSIEEHLKAPEIKLMNINIEKDMVLSWHEEKINLVGTLNSNNQKTILYINEKEIPVNEFGSFNIYYSLARGLNDVSIVAVSDHNLMNEIKFQVDYQPKVVELIPGMEGKYYALIIGISNYQDPNISQLERPLKDAESLYNTLVSRYTFEKGNIKLLPNPTREEILKAFEYYEKLIHPIDNLLIFYAGHGWLEESVSNGFWLPSDASQNSKVNWLRNSTIRDCIKEIKSKHTLLISDVCFGGSILNTRSVSIDNLEAINKLYDLPSRKAMTSGTKTLVPDQSVFLKFLIDRLQNNSEKYLSSSELFSKLQQAVLNNSNAVPQFGVIQDVGDEGGDFIFILKE